VRKYFSVFSMFQGLYAFHCLIMCFSVCNAALSFREMLVKPILM